MVAPELSSDVGVHEIVYYLKKIFEGHLARKIIRKLSNPKRVERILSIYCGVEKAKGLKERIYSEGFSRIVATAAKKFDIDEDTLRRGLKNKYYRKGLANVIMGIAEFGITMPQKLYAPFLVVWNFTKKCNLKCKHCYANAGKAEYELSLKEKIDVVDQLDQAGVVAISFSGGEPLIHKDLWPVAEYASNLGMHVSVATNGTLIDEGTARRLKEVGVDYVEISLDAAKSEDHDYFRGVPRAFERSVEGIKNCIREGIQTAIATTVTSLNLNQIPEIVSLAEELGVCRLVVFNFIPTGRGKEIVNLDLDIDERELLLEYLYDELQESSLQVLSTSPVFAVVAVRKYLENKGKKIAPTHFADVCMPTDGALILSEFIGGCGAGRLYCGIQPNGDITPCVFMPIVVGNVKEGFLQVWQQNEILQALRDRDRKDYACRDCGYRYICGGCRARAYGYFGDYLGFDPGCHIKRVPLSIIYGKQALNYAKTRSTFESPLLYHQK
jgi:radical SAM protein with 4Fe4S-binding SPASM domain